jgi:nicotinamidase-related amidase
MKPNHELPVPAFFQPDNAARWAYSPNQQKVFDEATGWRKQHGIRAAASDEIDLHLLLIDLQRDFCFPEGSLYVAGRSGQGAIEDNKRIANFIYRNLSKLTHVTTTLDTHFAFQIFFPSFWVDANDVPLTPYREIVTDDIDSGRVRPNPAVAGWLCNGSYPWLLKQVRHYCAELEKAGKYKLYLWPPHCILGSDGYALSGVIHEARMFHAYARSMQSFCEVKGGNPLTENYSVLRPEVLTRHDGQPLAQRNTQFLKTLMTADAVVIAGQAASHCVKSSIDDLLSEIVSVDPALAKKVYVMTDCMSSVTVPDGKGGLAADFTPQAEAALARFAAAGMHLVKSTDPLTAWDGLKVS